MDSYQGYQEVRVGDGFRVEICPSHPVFLRWETLYVKLRVDRIDACTTPDESWLMIRLSGRSRVFEDHVMLDVFESGGVLRTVLCGLWRDHQEADSLDVASLVPNRAPLVCGNHVLPFLWSGLVSGVTSLPGGQRVQWDDVQMVDFGIPHTDLGDFRAYTAHFPENPWVVYLGTFVHPESIVKL